jgi:hypothetical protein
VAFGGYFPPRVAMAILRHSRIALTMEIYTEVPDQGSGELLLYFAAVRT